MGQKVSPIGMRLGIIRDWDSKWYANKLEVPELLHEDLKIRKEIAAYYKKAQVSRIVIERVKNKVMIVLYTAKPGVVIGHNGDEIEKLKKELNKLVDENIQISIMEIKNPDLNAALVAESIAHQIENRVSFRIAQKRAIRNTMKAGAKGIKTSVSGRLGGADMARTEGYTEGNIPLQTLRANIDYAHKEADTTYGKIGVKVWIYKGEILASKKKEESKHGSHSKKN